MKKKLLLGLGTIVAVTSPVVAVVSCGKDEPKVTNNGETVSVDKEEAESHDLKLTQEEFDMTFEFRHQSRNDLHDYWADMTQNFYTRQNIYEREYRDTKNQIDSDLENYRIGNNEYLKLYKDAFIELIDKVGVVKWNLKISDGTRTEELTSFVINQGDYFDLTKVKDLSLEEFERFIIAGIETREDKMKEQNIKLYEALFSSDIYGTWYANSDSYNDHDTSSYGSSYYYSSSYQRQQTNYIIGSRGAGLPFRSSSAPVRTDFEYMESQSGALSYYNQDQETTIDDLLML